MWEPSMSDTHRVSQLALSIFFFFSSRRRHTILVSGWSSDVCSSDLGSLVLLRLPLREELRFGLRLRARLEHRRIGELRRILLLRRRRFGDFLRQPGAGLEFPREPFEDPLHRVRHRPELEPRLDRALVLPKVRTRGVPRRRRPDREGVLAAHPVLLE